MPVKIKSTVVVSLPAPEPVPAEFFELGAAFENGWIASVPGSRIVDIGSQPHSATTASQWAIQLLSAVTIARPEGDDAEDSRTDTVTLATRPVTILAPEEFSAHPEIGAMWDEGLISAVPGSGRVYVESEPHHIDVVERWALALLSASLIATGAIEHAA